jgi:hypothetical protein
MENMKLTNKEQSDLRKELDKKETEHMRFKRRKLIPNDFETIKIIGRGAFGEVFSSFFYLYTSRPFTSFISKIGQVW